MQPVAHRRLRHLREQRLGVAQQAALQRPTARELRQQGGSGQLEGLTGAAHEGTVGAGLPAHEQRRTDRALAADHSDFRGGALGRGVQQRDEAAGKKVQVVKPPAWCVEHVAQRQGDRRKLRRHAGGDVARQGR